MASVPSGWAVVVPCESAYAFLYDLDPSWDDCLFHGHVHTLFVGRGWWGQNADHEWRYCAGEGGLVASVLSGWAVEVPCEYAFLYD